MALLAGGLGLPIPEELALVSAGWFLAAGRAAAPAMVSAALAAMLAGDLLLYAAGRTGLRLGIARRGAVAARLGRLERAFARHGPLLLAGGRFVPGVRSALLVAAGAARVPLGRLVACDGAAALAGAAAWIALGWHLGPALARARAIIGAAHGALLTLALVAAVVAAAWWKKRRALSETAAARP